MSDFINLNTGGKLQQFSALDASTGAGDAGQLIKTNSQGEIDSSFLPNGIGDDSKIITASEPLPAGSFVNIFDNGGVFNVRLADATAAGREANGFVLDAVTAGGDPATVFFEGTNNQLSGLTPGCYFLSTTPGQATLTAPTGAGQIVQPLGNACDATSIAFEVGQTVELC